MALVEFYIPKNMLKFQNNRDELKKVIGENF